MQNKKNRPKRNAYIHIEYWMINELNLKGNELYVYAIIYGYSNLENQFYTGGLQYLADWTNSTERGIRKALKSLVEKGLVIRYAKPGRADKMRAVYPESPELCSSPELSSSQTLELCSSQPRNSVLSTPELSSSDTLSNNNISDNINNNISSGDEEIHSSSGQVEISSENPDVTPRKILELYNSICKSLPRALRLNDKRRKAIHARLKDGYTVDDLKKAFELAEASPFLRGEVNTSFHADIDWILSDTNLVKILENKYKARSDPPPEAPPGVDPDFLALFHQIGG